ncbi:MAG: hypothetical protein Fur0021_17640 [Candidatus Promineifilaceae bacterium]
MVGNLPEVLEEILTAHADDLNRGADTTDSLTMQYAALFPELPALLHLGKLLKKTLVPVKPRALFVRQLEEQLLYNLPAAPIPTPPPMRFMLIGALVGSALSLTGVGLLLLRRVRYEARLAARSGAGQAAPVTPTM